jgi:uncharacterized protein YifN (PemK superfamily)
MIGIVPLSTTIPISIEPYHYLIELPEPLPSPFDKLVMWAKCDMYSVVSMDRLDRFKEPKARYGGPRKWRDGKASLAQILELRKSVLCGLGFESLTIHP